MSITVALPTSMQMVNPTRGLHTYIPLILHLVALTANKTMAHKMQYRAEYGYTLGVTSNSTTYCNLHTKYIKINTSGKTSTVTLSLVSANY